MGKRADPEAFLSMTLPFQATWRSPQSTCAVEQIVACLQRCLADGHGIRRTGSAIYVRGLVLDSKELPATRWSILEGYRWIIHR